MLSQRIAPQQPHFGQRETDVTRKNPRTRQFMNEPIKLSIAATSKRVDIANVVSLSFFNKVQLPRQSQLDVAMGWRDSELGGTGPAILVDKKKYDFGFGNPVGLSRMAYLGVGFYKKKIPLVVATSICQGNSKVKMSG